MHLKAQLGPAGRISGRKIRLVDGYYGEALGHEESTRMMAMLKRPARRRISCFGRRCFTAHMEKTFSMVFAPFAAAVNVT
jgi:hypothetical protein